MNRETMTPRPLLFILLMIASLSASPLARAGALPPIAYPSWVTDFPREELANDSIAVSAGPSWARLPGGDTVVATALGTGLLIRRFDMQGAVRAAHIEVVANGGSFDFLEGLTAKATANGDGIYVLAGAHEGHCELIRFNADLSREWLIVVPAFDLFPGQCLALEVLPDDSVLALRESSLSRIGRDGEVWWSFKHGDSARWFYAADLAVDAHGTIWIASRGGLIGGSGNPASVLRLDLSGQLLSADDFLCATCIASFALSVDALPDGSVTVGGGSGSGQPGFFARYAAGGARLLLVDTEVDVRYTHLDHDLAGAVYAEAGREVRRIDSRTGAVLWTAPADEFAALDSGIATNYTTPSGIEVTAVDASGTPRWSRVVSSSDVYAHASRGMHRNGNLELLIRDNSQVSPTCGESPRLITLDDSGIPVGLLHACAMPGAAMLDAIDTKAGVGVLGNLGYRLVAYTPDGDLRWQAITCEWCDGYSYGDPLWVAATLTADGGAWAVERVHPLSSLLGGSITVKRIDPTGQIIASLATDAVPATLPAARLLGGEHDAVVLQSMGSYGVTWQLVREDGTGLGPNHFPMPDDYYSINDAKRQIDGSVTLVTVSDVICSVGCNPRYVTVMRVGVDGSLSWRYQFPEYDAIVTLADDGSALATVSRLTDGVAVLRKIAADGTVSASTPIEGIPSAAQFSQLVGPIDARWVLHTQGGFPWEDALWLIDDTGHVMASQRNSPYASILAAGAPGYLALDVSGGVANAALLDPASLAVRARLGFTPGGTPYDDFGDRWSVLDDGSVFGTAWTHRENLSFEELARFSVSGSPDSNLIFRDSFD